MASRVVSRLSSRLQSLSVNPNINASFSSNASSLLKSSINRRFSIISRSPVELSGLETMLPLHSAIAAARLKSKLSVESGAWGLVPQGISMPL